VPQSHPATAARLESRCHNVAGAVYRVTATHTHGLQRFIGATGFSVGFTAGH
jgi:hypothetical protein